MIFMIKISKKIITAAEYRRLLKNMFDSNEINGEAWSRYAAGYMWGITGIIYNPDAVSKEEASTWTIINNSRFKRQITIKDNVRDSMFAAIGAIKSDKLTSKSFLASKDYKEKLAQEMNDTSDDTIKEVQEYLQEVKDNAYSFETDSAKADMITGKLLQVISGRVMPCIQWIRLIKMILHLILQCQRKVPIFILMDG